MSKILILDDDINICYLIENILKRRGHQVDMTTEEKDFLTKVQEQKYDLFIVDLNLNYGDYAGIAVVKVIQRYSTPTLVLSAVHEKEKIIETLKSGAQDYIVKPVEKDLLCLKVDTLLGIKGNISLPQYDYSLARRNSAFVHLNFSPSYISLNSLRFKSDNYIFKDTLISLKGPYVEEIFEVPYLNSLMVHQVWQEHEYYVVELSLEGLEASNFQSLKRWIYKKCL